MNHTITDKSANFRVHLHGPLLPRPATTGPQSGALAVDGQHVFAPLGGCFEEVCQQLDRCPQVFVEPDGSFVYRCHQATFQIDGMIYDLDRQIRYIELLGSCPLSNWHQLLQMLGIVDLDACMVHDIEGGAVHSLQTFERKWFAR